MIKIIFIFILLFLNYFESYLDNLIKYYLNIKKISIIIPVFNQQKFLKDCLGSVINQTLKNIEIICIDDGSTDNSSKIIQQFSKFDDRFVIIKQENKGAGFSRNKGINISKGKYISFLDSDDMYFNDFSLQLLYDNAIKNKAIICGGGIKTIKKVKNQITFNQNLFKHEGFIKYTDYQYDYDYQRFIYNKNFIRINRLYFPNYLRFQDPPFFIVTMATAKKFYAIKNVTNIFRKFEKKEFNLKQIKDIFYGIKECLVLEERLHLYKLYNTTLNRLNMKYFIENIKKHAENKNLRKIIVEIIKIINKNIITKNKLNFILDDFYNNISRI